MSDKLYNVGMYIRLSKESTAYAGENSMSIENQQAMLSKFISMMPGWVEKRAYIDDGVTGGHFNRQGFQDMMADVRSREVNLILVQDLSRFGRNYLEAGRYLEEELPALGCRFVALADGIDTENGENDILPFLNAMNDYYLKNISDRIKIVFEAKAKNGHKPSGTAPYGYIRDPDDHTRLAVDEYASKVVRRIFEMRAEGMGYGKIVAVINGENIPPPRRYYCQKQNREPLTACRDAWSLHSIRNIVKNEQYLGITVSYKFKRSYRSGKSRKTAEDEQLKIPGTHTPIIDQDLWDKAQRVSAGFRQTVKNARKPQRSLFTEKLFCSDCGIIMMPHSWKKSQKNDERMKAYSCKTYHVTGRTKCSRHGISEAPLKQIVLDHIRKQAEIIRLDEDGMLKKLREELIAGYTADEADVTAERRSLKQGLHTIDLLIEQLYEDKITGVITAERFRQIADKTETRRREIEDRLTAMEQTEKEAKTKLGDIQSWVRLIKEKSVLEDVDRDLLETLIERIVVGEATKENGVKMQDVWIYYKFVGLVDAPTPGESRLKVNNGKNDLIGGGDCK